MKRLRLQSYFNNDQNLTTQVRIFNKSSNYDDKKSKVIHLKSSARKYSYHDFILKHFSSTPYESIYLALHSMFSEQSMTNILFTQ